MTDRPRTIRGVFGDARDGFSARVLSVRRASVGRRIGVSQVPIPARNSTLDKPARSALERAFASISGVMSTPITRPNEPGGDQGVCPRPRPAVDDLLTDPDGPQPERVAGPGHRLDGRRRQRRDPLLGIAEDRRQPVTGVEMEALIRVLRDGRIFDADGGPQGGDVE
jgi:hypothetical protein